MAKHTSKRSVRGILVRPRQQLRHAYMLAAVGMVSILCMGMIGIMINSHALSQLSLLYNIDADSLDHTRRTLLTGVAMMVFTGFLGVIAIFAFTISLGHRFFGPLIPLIQHIDSLKKGDYTSRARLRKGDELHEIADKLNELAEHFEKR